ncbi:protein MIZU-KUSSEI 1-like [Canna indica]|uniref:Protein MIZU-KUSSEI 1-like n=1 Tax=Canna indica TaxID=4628 RepID=A0AAQ3QK43_9LILI|nr:protein MIZU-KUSSEI 1-like [Canna indica]
MIDLGSQTGVPLHIIDTSIAVDCTRDVRLRRSLRSLVQHMVSCCVFQPSSSNDVDTHAASSAAPAPAPAVTTGTFFGYRRGRVSFCLHDAPSRSPAPILLLDFTVPTAYIAKEMQHGVLRIALRARASARSTSSLLGVPAWTMYCNGRKVGYAVRRQMSEGDAAMFKLMQSVSVGAGVVPGEASSGDVMYLRASFERVIGSADSESFHMINPAGSAAQQLSIFLLRTQ